MSLTSPTLESVTTINADGSRRFIHPSYVRGRFGSARMLVGLVLLLIYIGLPWVPMGGKPAVFFDIANRQFHLFGSTFVAQDFWFAFFLISGVGFALFYVTALFGRIWCGWACPQTVLLDLARKIECVIEGDAPERRKLDRSDWTYGKAIKRSLKHTAFAGLALVLSHLFLAYFISIPELYRWVNQTPREHWGAFLFVFAIAGAIWFNLTWFREQFCIVLCPYGRLQSALIDPDTVVIGYDAQRGEPRGKKGTLNAGDCIDCRKCVQVCPTGIDIRQGLQLECIACSACIDACDDVMDKLKKPRGLIRYDSTNGFSGKGRRIIRPRIVLYTLLLAFGLTATGLALTTFRPANLSVTRLTGAPYFLADGHVRNQFILSILSKRNQMEVFGVALVNPAPGLQLIANSEGIAVDPLGEGMQPLILTMPRSNFTREFSATIRVTNQSGDIVLERKIPFLGPQLP